MESVEITLRKGTLREPSVWQLSKSVVRQDGQEVADLRDVVLVDAAFEHHRAGSSLRIRLHARSGPVVSIDGDLSLLSSPDQTHEVEVFKRDLLLRYGYYSPDGRVDLAPPQGLMAALPGAVVTIALSCWFGYLSFLAGSEGGMFEQLVYGLVGATGLVGAFLQVKSAWGRPVNALEHATELVDAGPPEREWLPALAYVAMGMALLAIILVGTRVLG